MNDFPILQLKDIRKSYRMGSNKLDVLKGVNFTLEKGQWTCIFGASGSGKTTLLNIIGILEKPDSGEILFSGMDAGKFNRRQRRSDLSSSPTICSRNCPYSKMPPSPDVSATCRLEQPKRGQKNCW